MTDAGQRAPAMGQRIPTRAGALLLPLPFMHRYYDILRGLEYLRSAGVTPDERVAEAIELVASKRDGDGRWPLETRYPGVMPVEIDEGEGRPSRWNSLRALRVLRWHEQAAS